MRPIIGIAFARATRMWSHHVLLELASPFVRRGLRVDLDDSDRACGRLQFAPVVQGGWRQTFALLDLGGGRWRLLRRAAPQGARFEARLELDGTDPGALLARADALPPCAQWRQGDGWAAALHHHGPRCERIELHVGPAVLALRPGRHAARLELSGVLAPPDDLLAVLGSGWSPLVAGGGRWCGSVKLAGFGLEGRLRQAAEHLRRTFDAAPEEFHRRHAAMRWLVAARRAVPRALWGVLPPLPRPLRALAW